MTHTLPRTMEEAARRLRDEAHAIPPDQDFEVRRFQPGDAWAVARCFYEVYGEHYPFDTYYVPDKLIQANRDGSMIGAVAATPSGDVVAFGSLFRHFAPNPRLYETGQATVIPDYRGTLAVLCIQEFLFTQAAAGVEVAAIMGEPVCNHLTMQKISEVFGFRVTGVELGLMPGETYNKGDGSGGRITTLFTFKVLDRAPGETHLPAPYEALLRDFSARLSLDRAFRPCADRPAPGTVSDLAVARFDQMQAVRVSLHSAGADFPARLAELEAGEDARGTLVRQYFLNLGDTHAGQAVEALRGQGYFLGGFLPLWFGPDGIMLQKLAFEPDYASVRLLEEDSKALLADIRADRESLGRPARRP